MANYDGPYYENVEMSRSKAREELFIIFKYKIDEEILTQIINEIITDKTSMCSIRGYYQFQYLEFKKAVQDRWDYLNRKIK